MRSQKKARFFSLGRKWVFTLALFLFVFAAASVVKVQALGNVTGQLWGGSEDVNLAPPALMNSIDGNETGVGWISMSCGSKVDTNKNKIYNEDADEAMKICNGGSNNKKVCNDPWSPVGCGAGISCVSSCSVVDYGVNIPASGTIAGGNNYAWSENIGWIDFEGVNVTTVGSEKRLSGQARVIAVRDAGLNAGGWEGWIKMSGTAKDGSAYGVNYNPSTGKFCAPGASTTKEYDSASGKYHCFAWNGEELGTGANMANGLGGIDFAGAKTTSSCTPLDGRCGGAQWTTYCSGDPAPTPVTPNLCRSNSSLVAGSISSTEPWSWKCVNTTCPGTVADCLTIVSSSVPGECGSANGTTICNNSRPEWCKSGSTIVGTPPSTDGYDLTWRCAGTCSPVVAACSARGKKSCGWIETNP